MLLEIAIRCVLVGLVVSVFAAIGGMLYPKSLAGIFGAAPAVSLGSLAITFAEHGPSYVQKEARSMLIGALALLVYSLLNGWVVLRTQLPTLVTTLGSWPVWFGVAFGVQALVLR